MENHSGDAPRPSAETSGTPSLVSEPPTAQEAAEQLRSFEDVRLRSQGQQPSRLLILLEMWNALMTTAYVAVGLLTITRLDSPYHLVLPVIVLSLLTSGARERFTVRKGPGRLWRLGGGLLVVLFVVLAVLRFTDVSYPWPIDALAVLTLFAGMMVQPARLWRLSETGAHRISPRPLPTPARFNTALLGAVLGFLMATVEWEYAPLSVVLFLVLMVAELALSHSRWGLRRTGYDWAAVHWVVFGAGTLLLFSLILLSVFTTVLTPALYISAGSVFLIAMTAAAFVPRQSGHERQHERRNSR